MQGDAVPAQALPEFTLLDFLWVWLFLEENVGKDHTIQHIVKFKFSISEQVYSK